MTDEAADAPRVYRGHSKHKNRPRNEAKGTFCPNWTHATPEGGLGTDLDTHAWERTEAARLFAEAERGPDGKLYATARGMAFTAKWDNFGAWHGHPIPWEKVPLALLRRWMRAGRVSSQDRRRHRSFPPENLHWPLERDDG